MSLEFTTIISGIVLLVVFSLVGWNLRRKRSRSEKAGEKNER